MQPSASCSNSVLCAQLESTRLSTKEGEKHGHLSPRRFTSLPLRANRAFDESKQISVLRVSPRDKCACGKRSFKSTHSNIASAALALSKHSIDFRKKWHDANRRSILYFDLGQQHGRLANLVKIARQNRRSFRLSSELNQYNNYKTYSSVVPQQHKEQSERYVLPNICKLFAYKEKKGIKKCTSYSNFRRMWRKSHIRHVICRMPMRAPIF